MAFIIAGYRDRGTYDSGELSWDGGDVFGDKTEAHDAAQAWLAHQGDDACAEIIELSDDPREGVARRTLTRDGWNEILYPGEDIRW
jgi:hypothetical protein